MVNVVAWCCLSRSILFFKFFGKIEVNELSCMDNIFSKKLMRMRSSHTEAKESSGLLIFCLTSQNMDNKSTAEEDENVDCQTCLSQDWKVNNQLIMFVD